MNKPLLSVCLITYNQVKYIGEAIDSILNQNVDFEWELIIADDCSTDGTREILIEYKDKYQSFIRLILQDKNVGPARNWNDLITSPISKYVAYFEGDDYWIDPNKLQKQVTFLENNEDYGMVYTKALIISNSRKKILKEKLGGALNKSKLLFANPIPTLTVVFRNDLYQKFLYEVRSEIINWKMTDYPGWLWFYYNSKIYFLPEVTAVYRLLKESASHSEDRKKRYYYNVNSFEIGEYFVTKYSDYQYSKKILEYKNAFLYLYCVKHRLPEKKLHIDNLKSLKNTSIKTKVLIFFFIHLKFEFLVSLWYR